VADVHWVCLSDTHFGAENSILSHVPEGAATVDPATPSPVLQALVACLRSVKAKNSAGKRPILILNGDILELALAQDNVAAMVFDRFVDLAFSDADPIFDDTIVYLPGNHDHHVWETARERQYADYVATVDPSHPLLPPWHVTRMFETPLSHLLEAELLTALVKRRAGSNLSVRVVYPNLGLASSDGSRTVIFHHGHFTEPLYRLMSTLKGALFRAQPPGQQIWDWEADNFAWIDFFWSTLGRSGDAGEDVGLIYDMLQSSSALSVLVGNLVDDAVSRASWYMRVVTRLAAPHIVKKVAQSAVRRERANPDQLLGKSTRVGLRDYVSGPVLRQLMDERPGAEASAVSFVFGHTHKPFESVEVYEGFSQPVSLYNTGGWVIDTEQTARVQGASVVLIDDECNVASLRLYNHSSDPSSYSVSLGGAEEPGPRGLHTRLAAELDFAVPPWSTFSEAVRAAVDQRQALLPQIIRRGERLAQTKGRRQ
jgi:Calcineurin-like phosphoesterase